MNSVALPATAPSSVLSAEADLVRQAARGDADAFGELFRRHSPSAWRLAQAVAPDADGATAAFRDGFVRALRSHRAARRGGADVAFRPQVLAAVYRAAVDQAYDRAGTPATARRAATPEAALADAAFRSLPERWRAAMWLSEVENLPPEKVSAVLGVSAAVATQLIVRGRRGLEGRFVQARRSAPEHLGEVLRPLALAMPANLADVAQARWAAAGSDRGAVLAPVGTWMQERAVRPMSVAVGALMGLGLIGLGVVPGASPVRASLGAAGATGVAGALPVHTCDGLTCPGSGTAGGGISSRSSLDLSAARSSIQAGTASGATAAAGAAAASPGAAANASDPTAAPGAPTGPGGGATLGGGSGTGGGSGVHTAPPPSPTPSVHQVVDLGPVASVTAGGSALQVNLLPTGSAGSTGVVTATLGCPGGLGLTVGGTTLLGCNPITPTSTATSSTPTASTATPSTATSDPLGSVVGGVSSTVGAVVSSPTGSPATATAPTASGTTAAVTKTTSGLLGGL